MPLTDAVKAEERLSFATLRAVGALALFQGLLRGKLQAVRIHVAEKGLLLLLLLGGHLPIFLLLFPDSPSSELGMLRFAVQLLHFSSHCGRQ